MAGAKRMAFALVPLVFEFERQYQP